MDDFPFCRLNRMVAQAAVLQELDRRMREMLKGIRELREQCNAVSRPNTTHFHSGDIQVSL